MTFYEIEFPLASLSVESVEAVLFDIGESYVTFVDRRDEPVLEPKPGEFRLWSDTLVRALFPVSADAVTTLERLAGALGSHITQTAHLRAVAEQDWERVWLTG